MSIYEEIEIEDMTYDPEKRLYTYPCPCGDKFRITLEELWDGEDVAGCPSCTLRIEIIYDEEDLPDLPEDDDDDDEEDDGESECESETEQQQNDGDLLVQQASQKMSSLSVN